jgi:hypothetical protein
VAVNRWLTDYGLGDGGRPMDTQLRGWCDLQPCKGDPWVGQFGRHRVAWHLLGVTVRQDTKALSSHLCWIFGCTPSASAILVSPLSPAPILGGRGCRVDLRASHLQSGHLSGSSSPFCSGCFGDRVSRTISPGGPQTGILPISASQVEGITGVSRRHLAQS